MTDKPALPAERARYLPKKLPNEVLLRYRPLVELEKWVSQRIDDRTQNKTLYVILVAAGFLICFAPVISFLLNILAWIALHLGNPSGDLIAKAAAAAANSQLLWNSFMVVSGLLGSAVVVITSLPTHLSLNKDGIKLLWRHILFNHDGKLINWKSISNLGLELPAGKTSPLDHFLRFSFGGNKSLRLRLGCIPSAEERARLLESIETWSPDLDRDAKAVQALELPPDYSYTELWLQALSGPPKRERLTPLEHNSTLRSNRFTVDKQLGVGGQGTAYLAYDSENADTVVLKEFILPVYVDVSIRRQSLESFEKEARILRQLRHDQIVQLVDFFVEDHRGYLVLEHIDGKSLREIVLESGAMDETTVRNLALQMCKMQSYLHSLTPPVVHRDFTPDNLILRKDGMLKLVDFNVAQQKDSTSTGTVVGKHAYLPPEQFRGQPTTQSDIYSLGASLFFMLTAEEPEPISQQHPMRLKPEISKELDDIVAKATAIELKERYATAADLENELAKEASVI